MPAITLNAGPTAGTPQHVFVSIGSDTLDGVLYWYAKITTGEPTESEMISGVGADVFGSLAKDANSTQSFTVGGFTESTTYHYYVMQVASSINSNILNTGQVTTLEESQLSNLVVNGLSTVDISFDSSRTWLTTGSIQAGIIDTPENLINLQDYQILNGTIFNNTPALITFTDIPLTAGDSPSATGIASTGLVSGNTYQAAIRVVDGRGFLGNPLVFKSTPFVAQDGAQSYTLIADHVSYDLSANVGDLLVERVMSTGNGVINSTFTSGELLTNRLLPVDSGLINYTGLDAEFIHRIGYVLVADEVDFISNGHSTLTANRRVSVNGHECYLTADLAHLLLGYTLGSDTRNVSCNGSDSHLITDRYLQSSNNQITFNGNNINLLYSGMNSFIDINGLISLSSLTPKITLH